MRCETFKGGFHAFTGGIAAALFFYNLMRASETGCRRNGVNAIVYLGLWAFEIVNTREHWSGWERE